MTEAQFLNWILDVAARFAWRAWHVPAPMRAIGGDRFVPEPRAAGLPDLVLLRADPPRLIFAEVKGPTGKPTPEQIEFLKLARGVADALRVHMHATREVLVAHGAVVPEDPAVAVPVGVYLWRPGMEPLIEATLRSKVMAA